jgi:hypothetical protein
MLQKIKYAAAVAAITLLAACGGGGGGSSGPVASTSSFNLLATYAATFSGPQVNNFTLTGTSGSTSISGSGTATTGNTTTGTFEGQSALQRTTTVTGSFTANGTSYPLNSSCVDWVTTNFVPLGIVCTEYEVVTGTPTLPTAVHVGDTGTVYTANRYSSSSKTTLLGTVTETYVVEADTASTVLVTLIDTYKNTSNVTTKTESSQLRITTSNTYTRVKDTLLDVTNNLSMTLTF